MRSLRKCQIVLSLLLIFVSLASCSNFEVLQQRVTVNSSELCILPITPALFKWDRQPDYVRQIEYNARLSNSPDLPEWLMYAYDGYSSVGFLYGVPPKNLQQVSLDVIGWNRGGGYEVRKLVISMEILNKEAFKYVAELKIDNFNVKDMANPKRMRDLISVLSDQLGWRMSDDSRVTPVFMASAVELGENRVPIRPNDAEGVVIHLGSDEDFSPELKKLQSEVLPLSKLRPCPRDLKRTSVEKYFRRYNFLVDWCSFVLTTSEEQKEGEKESTVEYHPEDSGTATKIFSTEPEVFVFKTEIPERTYTFEILLSTVIPGSIGGLVGFLVIFLLRTDRDEDAEIDQDALFYEAAFRTLYSLLRIKKDYRVNGNGGRSQYIYHQPPQHDSGIVVMTRDANPHPVSADPGLSSVPIPPQYAETHPNGAPALIYAV